MLTPGTTPDLGRAESAIGRSWGTLLLCGVELVGHGVDGGGELLAHAPAEVAGVVDDDQAAGRPCLVQLPRGVERAGDVVAAEAMMSELAPFVWRKHLDFAALRSQ